MAHERILIDGSSGNIEVFVDPRESPKGMVIVGHPHPLFGGSADNKVVVTLARAFRELGCVALRPNFRSVGASSGKHDHGIAETDDLYAVCEYARARFGRIPLYLAGFSFGAYVITRLAKRLAEAGDPAALKAFLDREVPGHEDLAKTAVAEEVKKFKTFQKP